MGAYAIAPIPLKTARMRTFAILSVVFFALAVASFAQEADEDLVVPEMELVEVDNATVATTYHTQTVMQNETEVTYKPQGKVVQEPVEEVHMVPVTKTVPAKKQIKVETIVKEPAPVATGCDLVVESCFATPATEAVPAWKAPVFRTRRATPPCALTRLLPRRLQRRNTRASRRRPRRLLPRVSPPRRPPRSSRRPSRKPRLSAPRRARRARR